MPPRTVKLSLALASLALASVVAGCSHTRHVGSDRSLQIGLTEYRLHPQNVSVTAGVLNIVVHNYGRLTHNLVVFEHGQSIASTKAIAPGQSAQLSLSLAPGTYMMTSTMLSDEALGEYGTLTVD